PGRELPDYLALCDIAVNLRYPTAGEASGGVMRLFAYGKPTIVSRTGWFAELPPPVAAQVEIGIGEVQAIADWLRRLAVAHAHRDRQSLLTDNRDERASSDRGLYVEMSTAALDYAAARTPARAAQEYIDAVLELMAQSHHDYRRHLIVGCDVSRGVPNVPVEGDHARAA
ncbi:MAG: hypothetical protein WCF84_04950, partial [Anaerolineae bacterium]